MKTFTVIGYSVLNGVRKVRIANDLATRFKILHHNKHTDIELYEVEDHWPGAIITNKEEAAAMLAVHPTFARPLGATNRVVSEEVVDTANHPVWSEIYADLHKTLKHKEVPTFEMILATIPLRKNGRFAKKADREQEARDKLSELLA